MGMVYTNHKDHDSGDGLTHCVYHIAVGFYQLPWWISGYFIVIGAETWSKRLGDVTNFSRCVAHGCPGWTCWTCSHLPHEFNPWPRRFYFSCWDKPVPPGPWPKGGWRPWWLIGMWSTRGALMIQKFLKNIFKHIRTWGFVWTFSWFSCVIFGWQ